LDECEAEIGRIDGVAVALEQKIREAMGEIAGLREKLDANEGAGGT
jgi:hypothetical protein